MSHRSSASGSASSPSKPTRAAATLGVLVCAGAVLVGPSAGCGGDSGSNTDNAKPSQAGAAGQNDGRAGTTATAGRGGAGTAGSATAAGAAGNTSSAGSGGDFGQAGSPDDGPPPVCGDGYCDHEHGEECTDCPGDCGACGVWCRCGRLSKCRCLKCVGGGRGIAA